MGLKCTWADSLAKQWLFILTAHELKSWEFMLDFCYPHSFPYHFLSHIIPTWIARLPYLKVSHSILNFNVLSKKNLKRIYFIKRKIYCAMWCIITRFFYISTLDLLHPCKCFIICVVPHPAVFNFIFLPLFNYLCVFSPAICCVWCCNVNSKKWSVHAHSICDRL